MNAEKILPPATVVAPPAALRTGRESFRQVRCGSLGRLRAAHRLTATQERLLTELVLQADHRTAQVRGFTLAAWAEYLCEGRNTTARALRALEAVGLVAVEGLKAGREAVVTVLCWSEIVRTRTATEDQATAPERREPAQVAAPFRREDRAISTRGPRHFDAKDQGFHSLEREEQKNNARGTAETPQGVSADPLRAREESDNVVTALGFAFPQEDLIHLARTVDALRSEGVSDATLKDATTAALKAGARSLRGWWEPRVRDLHKKATAQARTTTPGLAVQYTQHGAPVGLLPKNGEEPAWCATCWVNTGEPLRPGKCHCDRPSAPVFGIVAHTEDHRGPQEPAGGWGIVTHDDYVKAS